jgi:hypothetical protein
VADIDPLRAAVLVAMVVVLLAVAFLEIRMIRRRRTKKEEKGELPDRAHNALLSAKAIAEAVARGGVRSAEADELIREADVAYRNRNYRVAMEVAERAKGVLRAQKARYQAKGDLTKVEAPAAVSAAEDEVTTKEKITKELPPNFVQSKFSMNVAREEIDAAKGRGQDVTAAERFMQDAQVAFDNQEYGAALAHTVRARRSLGTTETPPAPAGPATVVPPTAAKTRPCTSCGADVAADDEFCRTCGVKVPKAKACPACGTEVARDDAFCRKCGTRAA